MLRNKITKVCFYFCSTELNSELFFSSAEWFRTEFPEFTSISVPLNGILSIFLFRRIVQNVILRVFCSVEQPEFHQNEPFVSYFLYSQPKLPSPPFNLPTLLHIPADSTRGRTKTILHDSNIYCYWRASEITLCILVAVLVS
jgi:hypothetical protein